MALVIQDVVISMIYGASRSFDALEEIFVVVTKKTRQMALFIAVVRDLENIVQSLRITTFTKCTDIN